MNTTDLNDEFTLETCPICLEDIELCAYNYIKTECKHCFHATCFLKNTQHNGYGCPCCRKNIIAPALNYNYNNYYNNDNDNDNENDDTYDDDALNDLSLLAFRYLMSRVDPDNNENDDDDASSIWTMDDDDMYQRGHIMHGQQYAPNLSIEFISNKLHAMGLSYEDLVALYVLPHKDNDNDVSRYNKNWISGYERTIRNILLGR